MKLRNRQSEKLAKQQNSKKVAVVKKRPRAKRSKQKASTVSKTESSSSNHGFSNFLVSSEYMSHLPDHVLVSIFKFVPIPDRIRIERVDRRWRMLAKNYGWSGLRSLSYGTFSHCEYPHRRLSLINSSSSALLSRCGAYLQKLDLSGFRDTLSYRVISIVCKNCPNLTYIALTGIQLTNSTLRSLGEHCPKLKSVNMQRCFQNSIVETGLGYFLCACKELRTLDVSENERLIGFPSFQNLPSTLRKLNINGCYELTDEASRMIARNCRNLESLSMDGVDGLSLLALNELFSHLRALRKLGFGEYFYTPPNDTYLTAMRYLSNIRELNLSDNMLICDVTVISISKGCKQLESLDISGGGQEVTDIGMSSLSQLPNLLRLNVSFLRKITDQSIRRLAQPGKLEVLLLHRCDGVGDSGLLELASCCKKLKKLDVSYCPKVTDISVWAFYHLVEKRQQRLNVWLGRTNATVNPPAVQHPLLDLNDHDYVFENHTSM